MLINAKTTPSRLLARKEPSIDKSRRWEEVLRPSSSVHFGILSLPLL